ncbi:tryptophan--tRNA ligase, partial [Lactobacillus sp. XV13L]|nr:tryptophan--tRNA ligase [Lactobacillus sp. XV13L]
VEGNTVFTYLDIFAPDKDKVAEMKEEYQKGGLGDVKLKRYLNKVMEEELAPIRARRARYEQNLDEVYEMLQEGSQRANRVAAQTLAEVRDAIGLNYFD